MKLTSATYKPAVVIPAYRRPGALLRLLRSVNEAEYPDEQCALIISLEGGTGKEVEQIAEEFQFNHGEKEIIRHSEKLGLKSHIYECAGYSQKYGSVIVLEDDLIVSPAYYQYAVRALDAYDDSDSVAGISLYAQRFNETAQLPFEPLPSYYAGYFMMLACSWGQAWTVEQWSAYQKWREDHGDFYKIEDVKIPQNIRDWPAGSWKREFNDYLVKTGKTIFYPYQSVTTNSSHYGGENMSGTGSLFEVPLVRSPLGIDQLNFPKSEKALISYDMYMEANGTYIEKITGIEKDRMSLDLYGMKPAKLLTSKSNFITSKVVENPEKRFPLLVKPLEENLRHPVKRAFEGFFSLASSEKSKDIGANKSRYISIAQYYSYNRTDTKKFIIENVKQSLKKKL